MNKLLPERPHPGHLKDQARDLVQSYRRLEPDALQRVKAHLPRHTQAPEAEGHSGSLPLHQAQWIIAREYGFASWPKLKAALEIKDDAIQAMRLAIDEDDVKAVRILLKRAPAIIDQYLSRTSYYFGNQRPLAYACQRGRTDIVRLLLVAGADPHAEGNLAAARASGADAHIPIMELLLAHGLDVNTTVYNWGPLLTYPAETQAPRMIQWLLARGADPNHRGTNTRCPQSGWEALIEGYWRSSQFHECVELMIAGGARFGDTPALDLYRGQFGAFSQRLKLDPAIAQRRYDHEGANLSLRGTPLLHLCADWNFLLAAKALVAHGADVDAPAPVDSEGIGGHTPIFHTVNSICLWSYPMLEWLLASGADLSVRVTLRWVDKIYRNVTPLSYAIAARRTEAECERVVALLKAYGAQE